MTTAVDTSDLREQVARRSEGGGKTVKQIVQEQMPQIARALPKMMSADRFTRIVVTELSRTPKLQECSAQSLLGAIMYAAQLGIEPGPLGHAYLVPFSNQVTLIIGYRGLIDLARRSEKIASIVAREVCENDDFSFSVGDDAFVKHSWDITKDRGKVVAYYGYAKFTNGEKYILPMSLTEIDRRRKRSKAKNDGPWVTDPEAMSRKTVIRAMAPWLPLTPEVASAFQQDEVQATFNPDAAPDQALEIAQSFDDDEVPSGSAPPALEGGGEVVDVDVAQPDAVGEVSEASAAPASTTEEIGKGGEASGSTVTSPPAEPADNYESLSSVELEELCRLAKISMSGNRDVKIARLREHDAKLMEPM